MKSFAQILRCAKRSRRPVQQALAWALLCVPLCALLFAGRWQGMVICYGNDHVTLANVHKTVQSVFHVEITAAHAAEHAAQHQHAHAHHHHHHCGCGHHHHGHDHSHAHAHPHAHPAPRDEKPCNDLSLDIGHVSAQVADVTAEWSEPPLLLILVSGFSAETVLSIDHQPCFIARGPPDHAFAYRDAIVQTSIMRL